MHFAGEAKKPAWEKRQKGEASHDLDFSSDFVNRCRVLFR